MKTIDEHINKDIEELLEVESHHDPSEQGKVRHLEAELDQLYKYKENHPEDEHDPNSLELYCDSHPSDVMCKVYDD